MQVLLEDKLLLWINKRYFVLNVLGVFYIISYFTSSLMSFILCNVLQSS